MFLGGLYWIQLETQPIMMKFTTILLNAEFLRRITKCSRENFKFAVALLYPCNGTVACAPFTLQGSEVRNFYCPPQHQILKTINTLGSLQDFNYRISIYASLGSIFFVCKFLDSSELTED